MQQIRKLSIALCLILGALHGRAAVADPAARREALYDKLHGGVALLVAAPELFTAWRAHRYDPSYFPEEFKQEVFFYYLSGLEDPGAALLIDGRTRRTTLYLREDAKTPRSALPSSDYAEVKPRAALVGDVEALKERKPPFYLLLGEGDVAIESGIVVPSNSPFPEGLKQPTDAQEDLRDSLQARFPWMSIHNLDPLVASLRGVKDKEEIALMRAAALMTSRAMMENMRSVAPGVTEGQLEGVSRFVCRREGAQRIPYSEDIQSGPNLLLSYWDFFGTYDKHDRSLQPGELALLDTACEYRYYQSDMARTVPVSGKFTPEQRAVYMLYMQGYRAALAAIKPGALQRDISLALVAAIREAKRGLKEPYLIDAADDIIARYESGVPLGHFVDMYVYGAGDADRPLVPGQILTIEPAMVVKGLATRLVVEDLILVTANGREVLTDSVPREPDEVAAVVAEEGLLDWFNKVRSAPVVGGTGRPH